MMKNNDLDKFIKSKLDEEQFEYNPQDWQNALKLIDKEEKKRRPLWIWWAAAGLVLLLSAGLYFNGSTSTSIIATNADSDKQEESVQSENKNQQANRSSETINTEEAKIEEALVSQVEVNSATNGSIATTEVQKEVIPKITSHETRPSKLPDPIAVNNPKLQPISSPVTESVADARTGEDFSTSSSDVESSSKPEFKNSELFAQAIDRAYDSKSILLLTSLDRIGEGHYEPKKYAWETPKSPMRIEPLQDLEVKLGFGWGASAYVNPYVANLDGDSKKITGFSGGLSTMYRLDKTISLNADLLYTYRTGTFDKSNVSETRRYSFDAQDGVTTLNPTALHYVSVPVYAGLHFGRHRVTLGGSLNYLGAVRGNVVDQTLEQGAVVQETTQAGWIQKDGFTPFNLGGMIGYDYSITNRLNISFRSNYLFNPIIDQSLSEKINSFIVKENSQVKLQIGTTYYFR